MALFGLCFRESYRELMNLASHINPDVKFIDHSEERDKDPEARKEERRRAASVAFKQTFGRECHWFTEQQEDIIMKKEESELKNLEFQHGQNDDKTFQMEFQRWLETNRKLPTTLQSMMNAKLSKQKF